MGSAIYICIFRRFRSLGMVFAGNSEVFSYCFCLNSSFSVDKSWAYFLEALSGQFCASLSQLGLPKNYISPSLSYRPSGLTSILNSQNVSRVFRYAQLPHEELCTENLTPFAKLLPCKKFSGLATLLKPQSLFKASYNALSIDVRRICSDSSCKSTSLELKQSLTYVFNRRHLFTSINGKLNSNLIQKYIPQNPGQSLVFSVVKSQRLVGSLIEVKSSSFNLDRILN